METSCQGYFIYRESDSPTYALSFFPPKDSDDLFDVLRAKYPLVKSHSERMRDAIIEFLLEEQARDSMSASASTASPLVTDTASTSPWPQSWPSMSATSSSSFSSPELRNVEPSLALASQSPAPASSTTTSTPQLEQMTGVFSLTSSQPKQHIRRKMTEAEKIEYRKRRIVKACDKCSKRKRKCNHNQPAMESVPSRQDKITKQRASASVRLSSTVAPPPVPQPDMTFFDDPFTSDMQLFDDFTNILDDPLFTDDTWDFGAQPAHAEPQRVPIADDFALPSNAHQSSSIGDSRRLHQQQSSLGRSASYGNSHEVPTHSQVSRSLAGPSLEQPVPTHTSHTHEFVGSQAYQYDGKAQRGYINGTGTDIAWPQAMLQVKGTPDANARDRHDNAVNATCQQDKVFTSAGVGRSSRHDSAVNATGTQHQALAGAEVDRSTSFSVSSSSASPQGRPARTERDTFGSAIARASSPSTELYMLRRRGIPGLAAQNKMRLATPGQSRLISMAGMDISQDLHSVALRESSPVHTRSRKPSANGSASGQGGRLTIASVPQEVLGENRLSDHKRYKDHHGRPAVLQVIASALMAAMTLDFCRQTTSLVLAALCNPVMPERKEETQDIMSPLATMMQTLQV